jgi:hypothetical protein
LTSARDGTEYDLCGTCKEKVLAYIEGMKPVAIIPAVPEKKRPGRPPKDKKGE